jgi:DNA-binding FadR family transcriptional regulator
MSPAKAPQVGNEQTSGLVVSELVRRPTTVEAVVEQLKAEILGGQLKQGTPLPGENELCSMLKVSRATLRESLQVLEQMGVIARDDTARRLVVPNEDIRLTRLGLHDLLQYEWVSFEEVSEVIDVIGPQIMRLAAIGATPEQKRELADVIAAMGATTDPEETTRLHDSFHHIAVGACRNRFWLSLWRSINGALTTMDIHAVSGPNSNPTMYELHAPIAEAIIAGDEERAAASALRHNAVFKEVYFGAQPGKAAGGAPSKARRPASSPDAPRPSRKRS